MWHTDVVIVCEEALSPFRRARLVPDFVAPSRKLQSCVLEHCICGKGGGETDPVNEFKDSDHDANDPSVTADKHLDLLILLFIPWRQKCDKCIGKKVTDDQEVQ